MRLSLLALLLLGACGPGTSNAGDGGLLNVVVERPNAPPIAPHSECVVTTGFEPTAEPAHRADCSAMDFPRYPPSSGPHYGTWADFATYSAPVPWGFLLHSLEHGAVVLAYSCGDACPEVPAAFARIAAQIDDPLCSTHPNGNRIVLVPDPDLPTPIAAVAWEHVYLATCLDETSLSAFVNANYARARENLCVAGTPTPTCP